MKFRHLTIDIHGKGEYKGRYPFSFWPPAPGSKNYSQSGIIRLNRPLTDHEINLNSSVDGFVGANLFARSMSYVRINSHPQNQHNSLK